MISLFELILAYCSRITLFRTYGMCARRGNDENFVCRNSRSERTWRLFLHSYFVLGWKFEFSSIQVRFAFGFWWVGICFCSNLTLCLYFMHISVTLVILYVGSIISVINLLSCVALFMGIIRNKPKLIVPWLIFHAVGVIAIPVVMTLMAKSSLNIKGHYQYWPFFCFINIFNLLIWLVVFNFYKTIRQISVSRKDDASEIPVHNSKRSSCYDYSNTKFTLYVKNSGLKHYLSEHIQLM